MNLAADPAETPPASGSHPFLVLARRIIGQALLRHSGRHNRHRSCWTV